MQVITNIAELITPRQGPVHVDHPGSVMHYHRAAIGIEDGNIAWIAAHFDDPLPDGVEVIDAGGGCVIPGLIDCHTHTVFAGTREDEFVQRIRGYSYAEVAEAGGGIRVTVEAVRRASVDDLVELALPRLARMLAGGVTTVEIKSGYGLTPADELKMLRAIQVLRERQPVELVATYLAAHTTPAEFAGRPDAYLDTVLADDVLRQIADEKLAEFADVFCERTAFNVEQSRRVLESCRTFGLVPRVHADQITQIGASRLAAELGAASADHLEHIDDASIVAMRSAGTIGVVLPACSFFLGVGQAPVRKMIAAGLPIAVATDFNPGSSMVESLMQTLSIACTQARLTPTEALAAATANAAAVLRRATTIGAAEVGMQADLVVLDAPSIDAALYHFGRNHVRVVIKRGQVVHAVA